MVAERSKQCAPLQTSLAGVEVSPSAQHTLTISASPTRLPPQTHHLGLVSSPLKPAAAKVAAARAPLRHAGPGCVLLGGAAAAAVQVLFVMQKARLPVPACIPMRGLAAPAALGRGAVSAAAALAAGVRAPCLAQHGQQGLKAIAQRLRGKRLAGGGLHALAGKTGVGFGHRHGGSQAGSATGGKAAGTWP